MTLNKATLIGNVGKDPEIRTTQDGKEIANFSLATSERWKSKDGEKREKTEWHKIVVYNPGLVKVIKSYVKKGSKLYIEGAIQTRKWTDKEGVERYQTEITMQSFDGVIKLLDSKPVDEHSVAKGNAFVSESAPFETFDDDSIPF